jgi:hypothetical protein
MFDDHKRFQVFAMLNLEVDTKFKQIDARQIKEE